MHDSGVFLRSSKFCCCILCFSFWEICSFLNQICYFANFESCPLQIAEMEHLLVKLKIGKNFRMICLQHDSGDEPKFDDFKKEVEKSINLEVPEGKFTVAWKGERRIIAKSVSLKL